MTVAFHAPRVRRVLAKPATKSRMIPPLRPLSANERLRRGIADEPRRLRERSAVEISRHRLSPRRCYPTTSRAFSIPLKVREARGFMRDVPLCFPWRVEARVYPTARASSLYVAYIILRMNNNSAAYVVTRCSVQRLKLV